MQYMFGQLIFYSNNFISNNTFQLPQVFILMKQSKHNLAAVDINVAQGHFEMGPKMGHENIFERSVRYNRYNLY